MTGLSLRFAARSEIGRVRRNNEDAGYAATDLLVVADGMGGHEAGELASAATVAAVVAAAASTVGTDEVLSQLAEAVITSGEYIADVVAGNRDLAGMGTTMTVVALREDRIAMAHVGDSRAYVYRDSELQQMTKDHTFVQTLVDSGEITLEEAAVHPRRNLMMRAIDGIHAVEVDLSVRETRVGDRYLLCSDGLCGVINSTQIAECFESGKTWLVPVLSTIGVIALGIAATLWWLANQWFVGVYEKEDVVAIFQGVPAGGMYRLVEITEIEAGKLPEYERDQVYQTFESGDFQDAEAAVERLKLSADLCVLTPATPGCPELAQ